MKSTRKSGLKRTQKTRVMTAHLRDREYLAKMRELREKYPERFRVIPKPKVEKHKPERYHKFNGVLKDD